MPYSLKLCALSITLVMLTGCVVMYPAGVGGNSYPVFQAQNLNSSPTPAPAGIESLTTALPPPAIIPSKPAEQTAKVIVLPAKPGKNSESLWARLVNGFDLDDKSEDSVQHFVKQFSKHRRSTQHTLARARPYLWEITEAVEARGLPHELALLPAIESRFNPRARSHRKAQGLWQFMPATAQHMGLEQNWWVDARLDVTQSTQAALDYLEYLYGRFDDWALALAAYNCGEARVQRAINQADGNDDFWELDLPSETKAYVPKLLALSVVIEDYEDFNLKLPYLPNQQMTDTLIFDHQIDLTLVAKHAEVNLQTLQSLNPNLLRWATPPDGPHRLRVPAGNSKQLQVAMANIPGNQLTQWQAYSVREGDSLGSIAQRYGIQMADLKSVNQLTGNLIRTGQSLVLPGSIGPINSAPEKVLAAYAPPHGSVRTEYLIKPGDTLWDIAQLYKINVKTLSRWNGLNRSSILRPGKTLIVWVAPHELETEINNEPA